MKTSEFKSLEAMIQSGETVIQPVSGVSMLPMLDQHTDAVKLVKPDREIEIGDVVMYRNIKNNYVLHRVCDIKKNHFIIRGDNCVSFERVPKKNIVALTDGYVKNGKYIPNNDADYREYVKKVLTAGKPLIPDEWKYIVLLYKAAITESDVPEIPDGVDWEKIISLCRKQTVSSAIATVIPRLNPAPPVEICKKFSELYNYALKRTILFDTERNKILCELGKEHIRFIPMKGIIIQNLYPRTGMREFSDNDILYDKTRQEDLVRIMTSLGYEVESLQSKHDVFHKEPIYNFEMHKTVFSEYSPYEKFFSDIFDRAVVDSTGSHMSEEDFYLQFLAHYASHAMKYGSGLRPLGDLYLLDKHNRENSSFNRRYTDESLEKLGLSGFEKQMLSVCESLFVNGYVEENRLRDIMSGGVYGSEINYDKIEINKRSKSGYVFFRLFPPFYQMKMSFPALKSLPFLLPVCWIIRFAKASVNKEKYKTVKRQLHLLAQKKTEQPKK